MQEIEGNVERREIGIVSIIDERQPTHPRFHLKTHCHRLKLWHPRCKLFNRYPQLQRNNCRVNGIFDGGFVCERDEKLVFLLVLTENIRTVCCKLCALKRNLRAVRKYVGGEAILRCFALLRPRDALTSKVHFVECCSDEFIVGAIDKRFAMCK